MIVATYVSRKITLSRKRRLLDIERDLVLQIPYEHIDLSLFRPRDILKVYAKLSDNLQIPTSQKKIYYELFGGYSFMRKVHTKSFITFLY